MTPAPRQVGGATVVCFTPIDQRHRRTGNCRHMIGGVLQGQVAGLAICRADCEGCYYLFGCDTEWNSITDTWHQTLEEAKAQAEFEYAGVSATWQWVQEPGEAMS
jgi:hypothetical protein